MTEESQVKREICEYLSTLLGCLFTLSPRGVRGKNSSKYMKPGWTDISGMYQRQALNTRDILFYATPFFIEVKRKGGTISKAQHDFILHAKSLGAIAFVAESVEDVKKELA